MLSFLLLNVLILLRYMIVDKTMGRICMRNVELCNSCVGTHTNSCYWPSSIGYKVCIPTGHSSINIPRVRCVWTENLFSFFSSFYFEELIIVCACLLLRPPLFDKDTWHVWSVLTAESDHIWRTVSDYFQLDDLLSSEDVALRKRIRETMEKHVAPVMTKVFNSHCIDFIHRILLELMVCCTLQSCSWIIIGYLRFLCGN